MRVLILGGTSFVGFHIAAAAIAAGCQVTLFNRGKTNPDIFPQAERLVGDRDDGLSALLGKTWDVVIDVSGYLPRLVQASADLLSDNVDRYVFISTVSVYDETRLVTGADESAPLAGLDDETTEVIDDLSYGGLKALCEKAVRKTYGDRALIFRLGLMAGPREKFVERLYWIRRVAGGGEILVPVVHDRYFSFIDVRDLADFTLLAVQKGLHGVYNTGGQQPMSLRAWLEACQAATGSEATFVYIDDDAFLDASNLYQEIPFCTRSKLLCVSSEKAMAAGLRYRPLKETAVDIWAWDSALPIESRKLVGLLPEREKKLLIEWSKYKAASD